MLLPVSSLDLAGKGRKAPISHELVAHSPEWTTGSSDLAGKGRKAPISYELVVHFPEWTTGSFDLAGKPVKSADYVRASGPLSGVDHWLL